MKTLEKKDKAIFDDFFKNYNPQISEYTFTNLFMWNKHYDIKYEIIDECLFLLSKSNIILPPVGKTEKIPYAFDKFISKIKNNEKIILDRFPENLMLLFKDKYPNIEFKEDDNNNDYVYNSHDLISLSGRKYHSKKNHVNKFKRDYEYAIEDLDMSNISECLDFMSKWLTHKDIHENPGLMDEYEALKIFFNNYDIFTGHGIIIRIDGSLEGFTFGERLNEETAVIHIEKSNPEIPELYSFINNIFATTYFSDIKYINREQDLGLPGLRKAKLSYHPVKIIKKYKGILE